MKTKIGLPFGLVLVVFIGVFTTMLALGALSPDRADAALTGTPTLTLSTDVAGDYPDVTVTFQNDSEQIDSQTSIVLDFMNLATPSNDEHANDAGNWAVDIGGTSVVPDNTSANANDQIVTISIPSTDIPEDATVTVTYTQPDRAPTADTPITDIGAVQNERGSVTVMIDTPAVPQGVDDTSAATVLRAQLDSINMVNSPIDPGAVAQYRFTFTTPVELVANEDSITLHFDKDIKKTGQLLGSHIRISATLGT